MTDTKERFKISDGLTRRDFIKGSACLTAGALLSPMIGCSGSGSSNYSYTIEKMTAYIQQRMAEKNVPALSLALVDDQRVVWARGFGYADIGNNIPATADTLYEIGSVSKVFAATLVMQLVDRGLVSLDDPLTKYIPTFSIEPPGGFPAGGTVTIRSILTHHSGIPGDIFNGMMATVFYGNFNARLLSIVQNDRMHYPTDYFLMYSNTAVSFLLDVIEQGSGQSFESFSDTFFQKLGMSHTSFYSDRPQVSTNRAKGYINGQAYGPYFCNTPTAGSLISSATDLAQFIKMMHARGKSQTGEALLNPQTIDAMITRQNAAVARDFDYKMGLLWNLNDLDLAYAGRVCKHSGDRLTFKGYVEILPDHKLGIAVLVNSYEGSDIYEDVLKETLKSALAEKTGITPPAPYTPAESPVVVWTPEQLNALAGVYISIEYPADAGTAPSRCYGRITATQSGLQWQNRVDSGTPQTLVPRANGWFSDPASQAYQYEFREMNNRMVMIEHHNGYSFLQADRFTPVAIPDAWRARLGAYTLDNLDPADWARTMPEWLQLISTSMELKIEGDLLIIHLLKGIYAARIILCPISDTEGYMPGSGRNLGGAVRIVNGGDIQFLGLRYKKV